MALVLTFSSSYTTWKQNGGKTPDGQAIGDVLQEFTSRSLENLGEAHIFDNPGSWGEAPGVFTVPICDWATWEKNHQAWGSSSAAYDGGKPPCPIYPCCPPDQLPS
jgi:hypothetical protein